VRAEQNCKAIKARGSRALRAFLEENVDSDVHGPRKGGVRQKNSLSKALKASKGFSGERGDSACSNSICDSKASTRHLPSRLVDTVISSCLYGAKKYQVI